jgi:hypothetical protein
MNQISLERGQSVLDGYVSHLPETRGELLGWGKVEARKNLSIPPYPLDLFPEILRDAIEEVQHATQAPLPLVAQAGLSALAVSSQGLISVARDETLRSPVSLFMLSIAESGERKTTCDGHFTQPIREWQAREADRLQPEVVAYNTELDSWKAARTGLLDAIKAASRAGESIVELQSQLAGHDKERPEPVRVPRLVYNDITSEQLIVSLAKEWPSAIEASSEAGSIFGSHGTNSENAMRYFALRNVLWDGGEFSSDRRTVESVCVRDVRLSASLAVQRSAFDSFNERTGGLARGMGTWARYLVCEPESTQGTRFYRAPSANMPRRAAFHRKLTELLSTPIHVRHDGGIDTSLLRFSNAGQKVWIEHFDAVERELGGNGEFVSVRDVASKTLDNAARIAALFHVLERGQTGEIGATHAHAGCLIAIWYLSEAKRIFGGEQADTGAVKLEKFLIAQCQKTGDSKVSRSLVLTNGPYALRKVKSLNDAIESLSAHGRIIVDKGTIEVHPDLIDNPMESEHEHSF